MSELKNGDIVISKEMFGNMPLIYVGAADTLNYLNDCVVIISGNAVPMQIKNLVKVSE